MYVGGVGFQNLFPLFGTSQASFLPLSVRVPPCCGIIGILGEGVTKHFQISRACQEYNVPNVDGPRAVML